MKPLHRIAPALVALAVLTPGGLRGGEDARAIVERAFEAAKANEAALRDYVYHERIEERRFNRKGEEKRRESRTWDVTLLEDDEHRRLIAKDDRPLDARAAAREQRKLDQQIRKMQAETQRQRERRRARIEKDRGEGEEFLREITRAFEFDRIGAEEIDGIATHVISAEPRKDYQPKGRRAKALTKVRAKLWISRDDHGWVQADIEVFEDILWLAVYRLREGTRIHFKQRRLDDGVWITEEWKARFLARIALVYRLDGEMTGTYSNFRRFSADTTVTGWSEVD